MTDDPNKKGTENPEDGAGKGEELIAGKFKSQDDLIEAYKNSERMAHEKSEDAARWKGTVDQLLAGTQREEDPEETPEARERGKQRDEQYTESFIQNPKAGLREFGEELLSHVYRDVTKMIDTRENIREFIVSHPDVRTNPELFALELQKTTGNTLTERLGKAHETYNAKIAAIQTQHDEDKKKAEEFEKNNKRGATDIGTGGNEPAVNKDDADEQDESFDDYLKERKDRGSKMFGLNP